MKSSVALLAIAAGLSEATFPWKGAAPFTNPHNIDNSCFEEQKGGFNWKDLKPGKFDKYGGFDFKGWSCEDKKTDFGDKIVKGSCGPDKGDAPSFGHEQGFSIDYLDLDVEFETELELHYDMPGGGICKQRSKCKKGGNKIKNKQCGGAKKVHVIHPQKPNKPAKCGVDLWKIGFECGKAKEPKPKGPDFPGFPPKKPCKGKKCKGKHHDKPPCYGPHCGDDKPCEGDECPAPPCEGDECPAPPCEGDECPAPPCEGDECPAPPCEGDECPAPPCEGDECPAPPCEGDECPAPPCEGDECPAPPCEGDECPAPPAESEYPPVEPPAPEESMPIDFPEDDDVPSIPVEVDQPEESDVPSVPAEVDQPEESDVPSVPAEVEQPEESSPVDAPDNNDDDEDKEEDEENKDDDDEEEEGDDYEDTPETGDDDEEKEDDEEVEGNSPEENDDEDDEDDEVDDDEPGTDEPEVEIPGSVDCPEVVPKCLNTIVWDFDCEDNTDTKCYCPSKEFIENVFDCVYAHGENDAIVDKAVKFIQGMCAEYVPENPAVVTCAKTVTEQLEVEPTPAPEAPVEGSDKVIYTTITVDATTVVPCVEDGTTIEGSSTTTTIKETVEVPAVGFTPGPEGNDVVPVAPEITAAPDVPSGDKPADNENTDEESGEVEDAKPEEGDYPVGDAPGDAPVEGGAPTTLVPEASAPVGTGGLPIPSGEAGEDLPQEAGAGKVSAGVSVAFAAMIAIAAF